MGNPGIRKILVVDDEESMCAMVTTFLENSGYSCQSATEPFNALSMLMHDEFDLVISDIRMNGMDGLALTREIRRRFPAVDTIIMSGFTGDYAYSDIIEAGAVDFIGKPLSLTELKAKIARASRERRMLSELREANEKIEAALFEMRKANECLRVEIAERVDTQAELYTANKKIESLLSSMPCILIEMSGDGTIRRWNSYAENILGMEASRVIGKKITECPVPWETERVDNAVRACNAERHSMRLNEVRFTRCEGEDGLLDLIIDGVREGIDQFSGIIVIGADITEYKLMERQLVQSQKLESIGQLAAGIAHEINTPTQFIGDNTRFLNESFENLEKVHILYDCLLDCIRKGDPTEDLIKRIVETRDEIDFDFIRKDIPDAINQSLDGINRISSIVMSIKEFSHPGTVEKAHIDINKAIENTVTVARNEWKYVADILSDFDAGLPPVRCQPGEFNQVILNMIINSAHAIAEKVGRAPAQRGVIGISTRRHGDSVEIRISDNGNGIREDIKPRIFDPFFTTKEVGRGTGQGLAISHSVIVKKHGGTIDFESKPGEGTTFIIKLPI
jgi:PAS domain S-box-containing protein